MKRPKPVRRPTKEQQVRQEARKFLTNILGGLPLPLAEHRRALLALRVVAGERAAIQEVLTSEARALAAERAAAAQRQESSDQLGRG